MLPTLCKHVFMRASSQYIKHFSTLDEMVSGINPFALRSAIEKITVPK